MKKTEYTITTHKAGEILATVSDLSAKVEPPMVYCDADAEGVCFFDDAPNPYTAAIVEILNAQGEQGWILVQVALREQDMICFRHFAAQVAAQKRRGVEWRLTT